MSYIQSTYGIPNKPGNFDAVLLQGNNLVHYWRDNGGSGAWNRLAVISTKATAPGCIIQSSYGTPFSPGNFEVVVLEGNNLVHYWRDNTSGGEGNWNQGPIISTKATGPGTLIQTSFGTPNAPGNFEVIVPEGENWVHYYRINSSPDGNWLMGGVITP